MPSMTFVASANAVEHTGATPCWSNRAGYGTDRPRRRRGRDHRATKAMMPVHLAGRPLDIDRLNVCATRARPAPWWRTPPTRSGRVARPADREPSATYRYSFYVTKNITTIEGGARRPEPEVAARVERLALHGLSLGAWHELRRRLQALRCHRPGFKFNMTDVQAALGIHQLPTWTSGSTAVPSCGRATTQRSPACRSHASAPAPDGCAHARHLYQVRIQRSALTRDEYSTR